jgi:predicted ester cyclase
MNIRSILISRCGVSEQNKAMVRQFYEAIWKEQHVAFAAHHVASDFLGHSTTEIQAPQGLLQRISALSAALAECEFTIQDQIAEGDKVVTRWAARGVQVGEFEGLLPTGKMVTIMGIDLFRIAHGKIIEGWCNVSRQRGPTATPAAQNKENSS